jgi:hypothetical protein
MAEFITRETVHVGGPDLDDAADGVFRKADRRLCVECQFDRDVRFVDNPQIPADE